MTKKDYKAIAMLLRSYNTDSFAVPVATLVDNFCEIFSADNPRFDCAKFKAAIYA